MSDYNDDDDADNSSRRRQLLMRTDSKKNSSTTTASSLSSSTTGMTNPLIKRQIPVSLEKPSLRIRLEAYYSLIAPQTLQNRSEWLGKFDQIFEKVCENF